jgi:hypothetical protein
MGTLKAPASGVTVRMYRQGLGDCFLLVFPTATEKPFYMMIDCGVVLGTPDPVGTAEQPGPVTRVAASLKEATGGRIDLLVITHQHWDHVSGFLQARGIFAGFVVQDLWFAWTEDPGDELASKLRADFAKDLHALHLAIRRAADQQAMEPIANLLGFFGEPPAPGVAGGGPGPNTSAAALQAVRELAGRQPGYRRPGEGPLPLRGTRDVRVYVLGPPHDERQLRRINPSARGDEVYTEGLTARTTFLLAARGGEELSPAERALQELSFPFESRLRIPSQEAAESPFFAKHYGFGDGAQESWRRIDDDWLETAGEIALQLDSYTNNTSLALAIELASGKVLLFAADAQVGSWLSWDDLKWSVTGKDGKEVELGIGDLLARTVLYKVGHHGSHNATIRGEGAVKKGLELMTSPDLVAMLPVHHEMAVRKRWGKMPFDPLLERLDSRTGHRILRIDDPFPKPRPAAMSDADWEAFKSRFEETDLYLQYTVPDS